MHNIPRALECYHRLATDFTSYPEAVQTFYMLYRIYDRQGNTPQANYYRDMVLMGFPDSDFANLIRDNEYYKELLRRENIVEQTYEEMYAYFIEHSFSTVITIADQALELYPGHPLLPKFRYYKALSQNALGNRSDAITTLTQLLATTQRSDTIYGLAQQQVQFISMDSTERAIRDERREFDRQSRAQSSRRTSEQEAIAESPSAELPPEAQVYRYRKGQPFYVIILVDDRRVKATELQYKLTDFNTLYYANTGYRVNAMLFTDTTQMLTVHKFSSEEDALGYYHHLFQPESPLNALAAGSYTVFAISTQNYATFFTRKDPDAYNLYFKKYHLKEP